MNDIPRVVRGLELIQSERELVVSNYDSFKCLTVREKEIMHYVVLGYTNREISEALFISLHKVKSHRKSIISKLNISSLIRFHQYARAFRLIHLD